MSYKKEDGKMADEQFELKKFFNAFINVLENKHKDEKEFVDRFNNNPAMKSSRNRLPRTDLILGDGNTRRSGVIYTALREYLGDKFTEPGFERYIDVIVSDGNWWTGEQIHRIAIEVENNIDEFKGTLSDLLKHQALQKVGIFYQRGLPDRKKYNKDIVNMFLYFYKCQFRECDETEYLIILGPDEIDKNSIGTWSSCHMTFTTAVKGRIEWSSN
jgi:hypothetical protein